MHSNAIAFVIPVASSLEIVAMITLTFANIFMERGLFLVPRPLSNSPQTRFQRQVRVQLRAQPLQRQPQLRLRRPQRLRQQKPYQLNRGFS